MRGYHAIVLDRTSCATDDGTLRPAPNAWWDRGIRGLLDRLAPKFEPPDGVVALMPGTEALVQPVEPGSVGSWTAGSPAYGWQTFTRPGRQLHVVWLASETKDRFPLWGPTMMDTAASLRQWSEATGIAYHRTPGITGIDLLKQLAPPTGAPTWHPRIAGPREIDAQELAYSGEQWKRPTPPTSRFVHTFDGARAYLAAAINVEVCPWPLKNTGRIEFDKGKAGWWYVELSPWQFADRAPNPAGYGRNQTRWITTPTAALLQKLTDRHEYGGFRVLDSWTGPARRSVFEPWAKKLRDAYVYAMALPDPGDRERLRTAVKDAGNKAIGLLAKEGMTTYRPDWNHAIVALARANVFRKIWREGVATKRWPLRIETDCVHYESDEEDPKAAFPTTMLYDETGIQLGTFSYERRFRVRLTTEATK